MKQINSASSLPVDFIELEYKRESPIKLLRLYRTRPRSITTQNNFKQIKVETKDYSLNTVYKKISEGFWYMSTQHYYPQKTRLKICRSEADPFYELEYFFVDNHQVIQTDIRERFSLHSRAVFSTSLFDRFWDIESNTHLIVYKFIFTKDFLNENFYVDDPLIRNTILEKIINTEHPCYNRQILPEELNYINELELLVNSARPRLLQTIWIKSAVLQLFGRFFELQTESAKHYVENASIFSDAISLMRKNLEEGFPGMAELAAASNVSQPTFKRKFKSFFRSTPEHYFRQLQMEQAEALLKKPGTSLREVAGYFGYVKLQNFREAFKKAKGYFPADIRE
jgi:AraC-like DNA-binding protein